LLEALVLEELELLLLLIALVGGELLLQLEELLLLQASSTFQVARSAVSITCLPSLFVKVTVQLLP
jgi:hypothetical protein